MSPIPDSIRIYGGSSSELAANMEAMAAMPIDEELHAPDGWQPPRFETTIAAETAVVGPGTYDKHARRRLRFQPAPDAPGWRFHRADLTQGDASPAIPVELHAVKSASRALLLTAAGHDECSIGMAEHIICQRLGLAISNLDVVAESYDPPLFNVGSMDIVEALNCSGIRELPGRPLPTITVREPVAIIRPGGSGFLMWQPPANAGDRWLHLDVAIDFPNAIGQQRIRFDLCPQAFTRGAHARTNCSAKEVLLARTLGWFSAKYRNFGYTRENILIAGRKRYCNAPGLLLPNGKSVEAVWHRACLDLVAALSLLPPGWPAGTFSSYKGGHVLDVAFLTHLLDDGLLQIDA